MTLVKDSSTISRFNLSENWIRTGILVLQLVQVILFLTVMSNMTDSGPTLDDSWIHYQFARNLALHSEVSFNTGEWSTGTTSLLWDAILALSILAGIPVAKFSLIIGILIYLILAQLVYSVFRSYWNRGWNALFAVLLMVLTGNIIWYSLSGMETTLLMVLGLCWILTYSRGGYILSGIIAGLLILTRIEGMIFLLMGIFFAFYERGLRPGLKSSILQLAFALPFIAPTVILNLIINGEVFPTTMAGKKWLYLLPTGFFCFSVMRTLHFIFSWLGTLFVTNWWPQLFDRPFTIKYSVFNLISFGRFGKSGGLESIEPYSFWVQLTALLIGLVLFALLFRGMFRVFKAAGKNFLVRRKFNRWEYLLAWVIGINLLYILVMPTRGQGGRYQAVNFIAAALFMAAGACKDISFKHFRLKISRYILIVGLILIYAAANLTWSNIYAVTVMQINQVHRAAGEWLRDNIPPGTVIAVFDVGTIKYFSQLPIVDIAGLTDKEVLPYTLEGNVMEIVKKRGAEYLVMVEQYLTPREKADGKTLFLNDFVVDKLGIRREQGRMADFEEIKRFSIPLKVWTRPWVVVRNHSPMLAVYKIHWLDEKDEPDLNMMREKVPVRRR